MQNLELVLACAELKTNHMSYLVSNANQRVEVLVIIKSLNLLPDSMIKYL